VGNLSLTGPARLLAEAQCRVALDLVIEPMRRAARHLGYAIAVHGSLARDIDLVAIPWTERAETAEKLVETLVGVVAGVFGGCLKAGDVVEKPHGRRAWKLLGWAGDYIDIDLSVMPRIEGGGD
jgi:hypothetical protein